MGAHQDKLIDAFVHDLRERKGIEEQFLPGFRSQGASFMDSHRNRLPGSLSREDVDRWVGNAVELGEKSQAAKNMRTAGYALVDFIQSGAASRTVAELRAQGARANTAQEDAAIDGQAKGELWAAARSIWSVNGLSSAVAVTSPLALSWIMNFSVITVPIHVGALCSYFFVLIAHYSTGQMTVPMTGLDHNETSGYLKGIMRAFVAGLVVLAPPLLFWLWWEGPVALTVVGCGAMAVLSAALLPASVMAIYATQSALAGMVPMAWVRIISRMPRDYLALVFISVPALVGFTVLRVGTALFSPRLIFDLPLTVLSSLVIFSVGAAIGRVMYLHRDDFGFRTSPRVQLRASPDAPPPR